MKNHLKLKRITVLIDYSRASLEEKGAQDSRTFDTLKEAREWAKRVLTVDYQRLIEASDPFNYACIMISQGAYWDCQEYIHSEFWRKGYSEPQEVVETWRLYCKRLPVAL